jgi:hypothetical protein
MFGGNQELALSVNFTVLNLGGFRWIRKEVPAWSDPTLYSASGYKMPNYVIAAALETFRDPESGIDMPNISARYRALGGYSRRFEVWADGAAGGDAFKPYKGEYDEGLYYLRAHIGLQALKMNRAVIMRGA